MVEFVRSAKKHSSLLSETIYVLLNLGLATAVFYLVNLFPGVPGLAYLLIILSKWRVLAVRPRFWWDNVQSNLLDMMLGLSVVTLLWQARGAIVLQLILCLLYAAWLIILKPRTSRLSVLSQAMVAQFLAITALFSVAVTWPSLGVVAGMWLIGYVTVRHALSTFEEPGTTLLGLVWGLLVAELGWLSYHWTIAYTVVATNSVFKIPQIAIIVTLISYFVFQLYAATREKKARPGDILWPAVFAGGIILIILIFFNSLDPNNP